ncbi:MAG: thiol reductant ABC exporter subunit CydD [Rhodobacterales bacterium]|nr:MAG: thiol reductant ABC exporter subunit CydD [Rhodobacterales bacterium]
MFDFGAWQPGTGLALQGEGGDVARRQISTPQGRAADGAGSALTVAAALVWPVQAAVIAAVFAGLLTGAPHMAPLPAALIVFALAGLRAFLNMLAQKRLSQEADRTLAALRHEILHAEAATLTPSAAGDAGALAALAAEKAEALRPFMLRYRPAQARTMVVPLVILAISAWYSWAVALVLLVAGPVIPLFMALVGWAAKEASAKQLDDVGALSDLLVDRLAALSDLRLIGAGPAVVEGFHGAAEDLRHRSMAVLRIAFLSSTVLELFAALGVAMVAVWVGFALLGEIHWGTWGAELTPFAGIFMLLLAPDYFQPMRDLAAAWHDRAAAAAVDDEIAAWRADTRPGVMGHDHPATGQALGGTIRLRGVAVMRGGRRIAYPDTEIRPGARVALTGPSGSGKTTLLRLLAGLEPPAEGEILVGGVPLDATRAQDWRAGLGWMPQAPHFLGRSLEHNIGFGAPLEAGVLDRAQLAGVVASLPRGTRTVLGERGAGLSGGEARRVMLARAIQGAPAVLLADEPTADLDAETAHAVVSGLIDYAGAGGTLIVATHDTGLIARMDQCVDLTPKDGADPFPQGRSEAPPDRQIERTPPGKNERASQARPADTPEGRA